MESELSRPIFLDSDELDALDIIGNVVSEDTEVFVLLLTPETLKSGTQHVLLPSPPPPPLTAPPPPAPSPPPPHSMHTDAYCT